MSKDIRIMIDKINQLNENFQSGDLMSIDEINKIPKGETFHDRLAPDYYNELRNNISQYGIKEPIILNYYNLDNAIVLKDGHHRLKLANELGLVEVPVKINVVWRNHIDGNEEIYNPPKQLDVTGYRLRDYFPTSIKPSELGY